MASVYVIVHYDGSMNECPIEGVTFTSRAPKVVAPKKGHQPTKNERSYPVKTA